MTLGHNADKLKHSIGNRKKMAGFGVNKRRFEKDDTLPPGPGQYKAPDSCIIHNKGHKGFNVVTEDGQVRRISASIIDVDKPLLSVSQVVGGGSTGVIHRKVATSTAQVGGGCR